MAGNDLNNRQRAEIILRYLGRAPEPECTVQFIEAVIDAACAWAVEAALSGQAETIFDVTFASRPEDV